MSNGLQGEYVTDSGNANVYYAVQRTNGENFRPESLLLYSDMKCDPATAKLASDVVGSLIPISGGGGGGGGVAVPDIEMLQLVDANDVVVFVKYTNGTPAYFSDPAFATTVAPTLPFKSPATAQAAVTPKENINVLQLVDDAGAVVYVKYTDGVATYFSDPELATTVVPALPFKAPATIAVSDTAITTLVPEFTRVSGVGTITGKKKITIANVADQVTGLAAQVNGVDLKPGESVTFEGGFHEVVGDVIYDATGSELAISTVHVA